MAKILVVDDDPDLILLVRFHLERANFTVIEASSGTEGLKSVLSEHPDVIILDVMMETLTDGFQFALKVRNPDPESPYREYRDIPIIILTSIHETMSLRFSPEEDYLPVDDFIEKPFNPDELIQKINLYMGRKKA
jgi:CheY-like chemotaxis protein